MFDLNHVTVFWIVLAVMLLILLRQATKERQPLKTMLGSAALGWLLLFPVSFFLEQLAGITLAINLQTMAVSAVLGAPGVAMMAVLQCFM